MKIPDYYKLGLDESAQISLKEYIKKIRGSENELPKYIVEFPISTTK